MDDRTQKLWNKGFGKLISRTWLSGTNTFSFFDLFFRTKRGVDPEIFGAWTVAQGDVRRYVMTFADMYSILTEFQYINEHQEAVTELQLPIYETTCLKNIDTWDSEIVLKFEEKNEATKLSILARPEAASELEVAPKQMLQIFFNDIHTQWCKACPAFPFYGCWIIPLGGAFSVFDAHQEIALLDATDVFVMQNFLSSWNGDDAVVAFAVGKLSSVDEVMTLQLMSKSFIVDSLDLEAMLSFCRKRMFLTEPGGFANRDA